MLRLHNFFFKNDDEYKYEVDWLSISFLLSMLTLSIRVDRPTKLGSGVGVMMRALASQ